MQNTSITKEALADALATLLLTQPLSKISIKNITDACNVSRNTFYYHFKDKYELIHWIFLSDMTKYVPNFTDTDNMLNTFVDVCKILYTHRKFYFVCFQYTGQNSLYEYIRSFYYNLWVEKLKQLDQKHNLGIRKEELLLTAKMKTYILVGMLQEWVQSGMRNDYMIYFEQMQNILERESIACYT